MAFGPGVVDAMELSMPGHPALLSGCYRPGCLQEEMFDMNWIEYVRRDTEGSDSDTRRRAASELVKSLTERFPAEVGGDPGSAGQAGRRVVCLGGWSGWVRL